MSEILLVNEIETFIKDQNDNKERLHYLIKQLAKEHYKNIPLYRRLCDLRGVCPTDFDDIQIIPAVPAFFFKRAKLHVDPEKKLRCFSTSGTSGGEDLKGSVYYSANDLKLMNLVIDLNAKQYLFPDHEYCKTRIHVLAPSPEMAPEMIMVYGMARLIQIYGSKGSGFFIGDNGLMQNELLLSLDDAANSGQPVTLIGSSFGFMHLMESQLQTSHFFKLPKGSRIMDAGGFKGRSREVCRDDMLTLFEKCFGISSSFCVNVLGMTELSSQFYDDSLAACFESKPAHSIKKNAPWTLTWAVDPIMLTPLPNGTVGFLRHIDISNGGHPFIIQTDDLGYTTENGFQITGRARSVEARGCSLSADDLLRVEV